MRVFVILLLCVISLISAPVNAYLSTNKVIDEAHILDLKTHDYLATMLSQAAKDQGIDITIMLVDDDTVLDHGAFAWQVVMAKEATLKNKKSPKKRVYLILNASSHQAAIVLGDPTLFELSLQESLTEIQQKILIPNIQKNELNMAVQLTAMAMISALEDWSGVSSKPSASVEVPWLLNGLKWGAQLGLIIAFLMLLRVLFHRPHWRELSVADEEHLNRHQQQSIEMAYWRTHRHIRNS
ncbi:TPM domain-containing protein [Candidatus Berkiella aquae]|uniref:TPM domain-containing protein n=1 Tax=Candidatus Berkiella aquae TaxID=295108 RepID=A0A0Q9YL87_9GAMM|nr:TPM domain-containing protein [Candidatus Berkiella aquae]MCS5710177.1 TPM domain-containing protein [Candidatus Berkiella aquae]